MNEKLFKIKLWFWYVPRFMWILLLVVMNKRARPMYYDIGDQVYCDLELANDIVELVAYRIANTRNSNRVIINAALKLIDSKRESTAK